MRFLFIEDDTLMRKMLRKIVQEHFDGCEIVECENGRLGVETYDSSDPFDIAIVDIEMPELDGHGVVSYIRSEKKDKSLPIVICSSRHDRKTVLKLLQSGASDYLAKPFEPAKVVEKIKRVLDRAERIKQMRNSAQHKNQEAVKEEPATTTSTPEGALEEIEADTQKRTAESAGAEENNELSETSAPASLKHGNIGEDIIDDSDDEKVYVDITDADEDDDPSTEEISEDDFMVAED